MALLAAYMVPHPPIIIPEIGKGEERKIQKTISAYEKIAEEIKLLKPDLIIVSSPHAPSYYDYIQISDGEKAKGSFNNFGSRVEISVNYDREFISKLNEELAKNNFPAGILGEQDQRLDHGTMIPLYFLNKVYKNYDLIRISISGLPLQMHFNFGRLLQKVITESRKKVVYLASGDLSHKLKKDGPYGFVQEGVEFDDEVAKIVRENKLEKLLNLDSQIVKKAAECGLRSFAIMAGLLSSYQTNSSLLSYEKTFGVGYMIAKFIPVDKIEKKISKDPYVNLAEQTIKYYILNRKKLEIPNNLPDEMTKREAGVFVSIKKFGQLRGCIGTFLPTTSCIAEEIIQNAISSSTKDPRFPPIQKKELEDLEISVDVLSSPEPVEDLRELDPKVYGVIVSSGRRSGLLLPNLDGVDTVDEQISISLRKAGIPNNSDYSIKKFKVVRHI
jgi:AmmeMemoRadiSam system protein A